MNKEDERITYDEFMTMFKFAPRMCYTLYDRAENEIENLQKKAELGEHYKHLYSEVKKQKDDVVEYIKHLIKRLEEFDILERKETGAFWYQVMGELEELLRMLGEIE